MKLIYLLIIISSSVIAANTIKWQSITPEQQKLLLAFEPDWSKLDTKTTEFLLNKTNMWLKKSTTERKRIKKALNRFNNKSSEQKIAMLNRFMHFESLPPEKRRQIRRAQKRFKKLPPEQREQLRHEFKNKNAKQKQRLINKAINANKRKQFINQFELSKREPIKLMIKSLSPQAKRAYRQQMKTLTKQERYNFTLRLLKMKPDKRMNYLTIQNPVKE